MVVFSKFANDEDYIRSEAAFGGDEVTEEKLRNIKDAVKLVFGQTDGFLEFNLELSHKIHREIHKGKPDAGVLHDPAKHGLFTSQGSRAAGLSVSDVEEKLKELFELCGSRINQTETLSRDDKFYIAAYFIHRYLKLHPYKNGNGRVARLMTCQLLIQLGAISHSLRFDKPENSRERYIDGLQKTGVTGPESVDELAVLKNIIKEAARTDDRQPSSSSRRCGEAFSVMPTVPQIIACA
ncbi:hypothetical protein BOX15_Mlig013239g1 [Macrostomum lignano]|uniref:Fido domain-containing protein n=1 Tax=Macrostomum lignano TaxID=282301 RepID=A0A267GS61_9PLAT|nr:hypothetical protein BOX15_Mlig013239g1 [Macrostomum lignano]